MLEAAHVFWSMEIFGTNLATLGGSQIWTRQQTPSFVTRNKPGSVAEFSVPGEY